MGLLTDYLQKDEREAKIKTSRIEAETKRREANLKLAQAGYFIGPQGGLQKTEQQKQEDEVRAQEMNFLQQRAANSENKLALIDSDQALVDFMDTGDASDLQSMLNNNDSLKNLWASRGVNQVANIDWAKDTALLDQAGMKPELYDTDEEKDELSKMYFKISNGSNWYMGSIETMVKETGILKRLNSKRRDVLLDQLDKTKSNMTKNAFITKVKYVHGLQVDSENPKSEYEIAQEMMSSGKEGTLGTTYMQNVKFKADATGKSINEIVTLDLQGKDSSGSKSREEKVYNFAMQPVDQGGLGMSATEAVEFMKAQTQKTGHVPTKIKELEAAQAEQDKLTNMFGGEDNFWKTDFSDVDNYRKAAGTVTALERLEGHEYTNQEKESLNDIRSLLAIGTPGAELTQQETGLVDNMLKGLSVYISDEVGGTESRAAYATFRNSVRHALFGSALTEAEIKAFNQAYGTLGQQLGPVLTKFRTSLTQVKARLDSIARMKNPYSAHVRLGVDQKKVNGIINALQQRIDLIDKSTKTVGEQTGGATDTTTEPPTADTFNWF